MLPAVWYAPVTRARADWLRHVPGRTVWATLEMLIAMTSSQATAEDLKYPYPPCG